MAQIASVVGRSFTEQLIQRVADTSADSVADALRKLTAAGIISSHTSPDGLRYEFRHALIQDAAYESLLKRDRVALHLKVARLLEERFPEHVARIPNCWATTSPTAGRRRMQPAASSGPAAKRRGRLHWRRQRRIIAAASTYYEMQSRAASAAAWRCGPDSARERPHGPGRLWGGQPSAGLDPGDRAGRGGGRRRRADRGTQRACSARGG